MKSEACCPGSAKLVATLAATAAGLGLLMLPAACALREHGRTTTDDITTLDL